MRSDLIHALKLKAMAFAVAGLPVAIHIRPWTMGERAEFLTWRKANPGYAGLCEKLFALSVCDSEGKRLFEDTPEELAVVAGLDGVAVQKVAERSIELNGLGDESPKA